MKKNRIEIALEGSEEELDFYLSDVSKEEFREDIADLKRKYADKGVIEQAIEKLKELL